MNYNKIKKDKIPVVSLFSGGGFMDMGFMNAGFQVVFANEKSLQNDMTRVALHGEGDIKRNIARLQVQSPCLIYPPMLF